MLTHRGGHTVGAGTYWDLGNGHRVDMAAAGALPGSAVYLRTPAIVMALSGPVLGLAYVLILPFFGILITATLAISRMLSGMSEMAAKSLSFGWRPRTAYLSGRKKKRQEGK